MSKTNRVIPYGYKVENGQITFCIEETIEVKNIYTAYKNGMSYQAIADDLTQRKVCYLENRYDWNKSRVKRILQNNRYIGNADYPQMISDLEYNNIQSMIENKSSGKRETPRDVLMLRGSMRCQKCGATLTRYMTHKRDVWKCPHGGCNISITNIDLTRKLQEKYKEINGEELLEQEDNNKDATNAELEWIVDSFRKEISAENIDEEKAKQLILSYAMAEYSCTQDTITLIAEQKIKQILTDNTYQSTIEKITLIADSIVVNQDKTIDIILKTGKKL